MNTLQDTLGAVSALVGSVGAHAADAAPLQHPHNQAVAALRTAQIELYCDHDAAALVALREARRCLIGDEPAEVAALSSVDAAAWHIRRHEAVRAQTSIARARLSLT